MIGFRHRASGIHPSSPSSRGRLTSFWTSAASVLQNGLAVALTEEKRQEILGQNHDMASNALRVLGVAYRPLNDVPESCNPDDIEKDLTFIGLLGMIDPPRPEVVEAVKVAAGAGLKSVMVTGDYRDTAEAIAGEIGLLTPGGLVLTGTELDRMSDEQLTASRGQGGRVLSRLPGAQDEDRRCPQGARPHRGHDRRRRERRAGPEAGEHRHRHGHYRNGRLQGGGGHGPDGRQLRQHRLGHRAGQDHLFQHPEVRLLSAGLQRRRDPDRLRRHADGAPHSAQTHSTFVVEPGFGWRPGPGPGNGEG